jgi:hypothetical protein
VLRVGEVNKKPFIWRILSSRGDLTECTHMRVAVYCDKMPSCAVLKVTNAKCRTQPTARSCRVKDKNFDLYKDCYS